MRWIMGYMVALCILVLILTFSITIPTFFTPFYDYQYTKLNVPENIQVEKDTLMMVTGHLLAYMRGNTDDLNVTAQVAGEERDFFSQREKDHMIDVQDLFDLLFTIRSIAFWFLLFLLIGMVLQKYDILFILARCCREVLTGFLILSAMLVIIISFDFDRAFTIFHLMFFNNDLWILDPAADLLINMVPLPFFIDISIFISVLVLLFSGAVILLSWWYLSKTEYSRR